MATPALRAAAAEQEHDALLQFVVASICIAVERSAGADSSRTNSEANGARNSATPSPLPTLEALVRTYNNAMWTQPMERDLQALNDWSLAKASGKTTAFERDIPYPVPVPGASGAEDDSSVSAPPAQHTRRSVAAAAPALFQLSKIVEDALEARWDHRGHPVPLRRNVLGEPYVSHSDPLQFLKQRPLIPASQIYERVKQTMRSKAIDREKRRIQALNDRKQQRKEQLLAAAQSGGEPALSPEDALEAKLDRLLLVNDSSDNTKSDVLSADDNERRRTKDGDAEEETEDDNQRQQLAA